jgi:hypothetical protein
MSTPSGFVINSHFNLTGKTPVADRSSIETHPAVVKTQIEKITATPPNHLLGLETKIDPTLLAALDF